MSSKNLFAVLNNDKKIEINRKKTLIGNAEGNREIPSKKQVRRKKQGYLRMKLSESKLRQEKIQLYLKKMNTLKTVFNSKKLLH